MELWHFQANGLRRYLRGWGANVGRDSRLKKEALLLKIQELDDIADRVGLDDEGVVIPLPPRGPTDADLSI